MLAPLAKGADVEELQVERRGEAILIVTRQVGDRRLRGIGQHNLLHHRGVGFIQHLGTGLARLLQRFAPVVGVQKILDQRDRHEAAAYRRWRHFFLPEDWPRLDETLAENATDQTAAGQHRIDEAHLGDWRE